MSPALISALVYLLSEAMISGVQFNKIMMDAKQISGVSDETWASILSEIAGAEDLWAEFKPKDEVSG
jgi:hypothetical protein